MERVDVEAVVRRQSALLFVLLGVSGACALADQVVWYRAFRLTFGSSTVAQALVVAAFLLGLGAGARWFGAVLDRREHPLRAFAGIELAIGLAAAASLPLLGLLDHLYVRTGGSFRLGAPIAHATQLVMALLTVGPPAFFMGGSLPAMLRVLETDADAARRRAGLAIGVNTSGAVLGALATSFYLLEHWGLRAVLLGSAATNLAVAALALVAARRSARPTAVSTSGQGAVTDLRRSGVTPTAAVLAAAFLSGFVFFLMELVWARMLSPLLGGSTYTFGLILATALTGLAVGGLLYGARGARRPCWGDLALVSGCEAVALALPLLLGDRIAMAAVLLRGSADGFPTLVLGWSLIAALVVLPPALAAGYQFPLLVALLGPGRISIGRDLGSATLWNTSGSVLGCLAGAFLGVFPRFGALGLWRGCVVLLVVLAAASFALALRTWRCTGATSGAPVWTGAGLTILSISAALLVATLSPGPSAAWRHSPIGAGRLVVSEDDETGRTRRQRIHDEFQSRRRAIIWQTDGVESSVALAHGGSLSFLINGKTDGTALRDASTQVMTPLLGALLHPDPRSGLVIGFGTGSSAGWLARVPSIERVDVVELEPAVLELAAAFDPVNASPLDSSKVRVQLGDARERLRTASQTWDLIFSEPSNPYRAGVGSLFTREFYRAARERLADDGLFLQWLQAYEIDRATLRTVLATLDEAFDHVEVWQTAVGDLLLLAANTRPELDVPALRRLVATDPWSEALRVTWWTDDLEGVLARFVLGPRAVDRLARDAPLNTDDRLLVEYSFARTVGRSQETADAVWLRSVAREVGDDRPPLQGLVDWQTVQRRQATLHASEADTSGLLGLLRSRPDPLFAALGASLDEDSERVLELWSPDRPPEGPLERLVLAEALAALGDPRADAVVAPVARAFPAEAFAIQARLRYRTGDLTEATRHLVQSFRAAGSSPWSRPITRQRALQLAVELGRRSAELGRPLFQALEDPWSVGALEEGRLATRLNLSQWIEGGSCGPGSIAALEAYEPYPPWQEGFLARRAECYTSVGHPLAGPASTDLGRFRSGRAPKPVRSPLRQ